MRSKRLVALAMVVAFAGVVAIPAAFAGPTIKFAHVNAVSHAINLSAEKFKELVEARSGGSIKVQVYPASQLGNEKDLAEGVKMGTVDMISISSGMLAMFLPPMGVFDCGYIFRDQQHQWNVLTGPIGQDYVEKLAKQAGVRILQFYYQGERNLTSNKPVYRPADLKGMKIRTPDVKGYVETVRAMGASPTPIAFDELFTALQLNVVDGQENPLPTILAMKFYEVQKNVTLTRHMAAPGVLAINERLYQRLSTSERRIVDQAILEAALYHNSLIVKQMEEAKAELKRLGMTIIEPTEDAMNEWRRMAAAALPKVFADVWDPGIYEKIINVK